jgi:hypothetical protein
MALWAQIALLIILGIMTAILAGIRDILVDGMKALNNRLQEITERLDELCEPEKERQRENRRIESEIIE